MLNHASILVFVRGFVLALCAVLAYVSCHTILFTQILFAQAFTPFQPDASAFPLTKARFYALSPDGQPILNITNSNFTITENGVRRDVVSIEFPPNPSIRAISAVLAVDVSGSMSEEGRMVLARDAATDWIKTIALETSECALTSFDDDSYVNQDFTQIRGKLLGAAQNLKPLNGTNYDNGFVQALTGSLNVARRGRFKRIVVFLTDGLGGGTESRILEAARRDSITVHCITLGLKMPKILRSIVDSTGGSYFENITSRDELIRIYRNILFESQNILPGTITWTTEPACISSRESILTLRTEYGELRSSLKYETPPISLVRLAVQPRSVTFREVAIGNSQGQRITLRATFQPVTITTIETNNPAFKIGGIQLPLTVSSGNVVSFVVGFTPQDSTPQVGRIDIRTATCSPVPIFVRATYSNKQAATVQTMSITAPSGGDVLYSGADTVITWSGLMPSEAVALEYSTDAGSTWKTITESAVGLRSSWRVPPVQSGKLISGAQGRPMLVRARQVWQMPEGSEEPYIVLDGHWGSVLSASFNSEGTKILTASADRTIRLWDAYTGISQITYEGHTGGVNEAVFSPDGTKILSASQDNTARLWDVESAQILATGYGQGLNQYFFSQAKMTGAERLQFSNTDCRWMLGAAFSPDGKDVMTTTDIGMAVEWKSASMRPVGFVRQSGGSLYSVKYGRKGDRILTAGGDYSARIWLTKSRVPEASFFGHSAQVLYASFSPDETRVVTASEDRTARVWDVQKQKPLFAMAHSGAVWSAEYSPDGKRIVTASVDGTVRLWDALTGKPQAALRQVANKLGFHYAQFSPDGSRIVAAGIDTFGYVWEVGGGFLQEAQTKTFTVIAPQATVKNVNLGTTMLGVVKDTLVSVIANNDKSIIRVKEARILGAHAEDFSLVSGMPPFDVNVGGSKSIEIRFHPQQMGLRTATLELITWTDTLRSTIRGEALKKAFQISPTLSFGQVLVKKRADTTLTLLRNTGAEPLTITRIQPFVMNPSDKNSEKTADPFSVQFLLKRPPLTIQAGDSLSIQASFMPSSIGITSGGMRVEVQGIQKPLQVLFVGEGVFLPLTASISAELLSVNAAFAKDSLPQGSSNLPSQPTQLRIEEFETTMVRPVLNYVFFEENSADLPARYQRLLPDSTATFSEDNIEFNKVQSGLEGYWHVLNVFGKRLKDRTNTTLKLIGCNSDDALEKNNTALSRRRAEAVRDYFVFVWGIEPRRISIFARNKPERASNPLDPDGAAENRRVEMLLEPQEAMFPVASNEAVFTAEPSIIRLSPILSPNTDITEWSLDMMFGSRVISTLSGTGAIPTTLDYRPTSAELRRIATIKQKYKVESMKFEGRESSAKDPNNQILTFRLRASNSAGQSVLAQSGVLSYSIITLQDKLTKDTANTRLERFALTFFDFDKSNLNLQNTQILSVAKRRIAPNTDVSVLGYTDRLGDAAYNKRLSTDRANAVAALIPTLNKQTRGFGESLLLYDNTYPEGRFYCRMVEILLKTRTGFAETQTKQ